MAWGYLLRYRHSKGEDYKRKVFACLEWLDKNRSPLYPYHSWGNHFFYASRGGNIQRNESTIVWTGLIGQAFLEAYELFNNPRHREIIQSIADWIIALPREHKDRGQCLPYANVPGYPIHNANMIGAAFLAGAARITENNEYSEVAR